MKTPRILTCAALPAILTLFGFAASAATFVKDVMVVGGTKAEVNTQTNSLAGQGWTVIDKDLNDNCGPDTDYIYLLYKTGDSNVGANHSFITDFYLSDVADSAPASYTSNGRTYYLVPYDGGSHFKSRKGDLNSNAGGKTIHLYYTTDVFSDGNAVTGIVFNATSTGAVVWNGNGDPADLNKGCGSDSDYIYMHLSKTPVIYTITYNLASGSGTPGPTSYGPNTSTFTLNNPTRSYYTFAGWTGTGLSSATKTVTIGQGSTGNRSYTATWSPVNYSINYTLNGGTLPSGTSNPGSYNIETATFTLPTPTRTGYTFVGWTGSNGNTAQTSVSIAKGSTGNKSYTANWTPTPYSITYNTAGGTLPSGTSNPGSYNVETATFTLPQPTRDHYIFAGWTGSNGNTPQINVSVTKGSTGNRTYTANWTPTPYSISYTLAGGSLPSGTSNPGSYNIETATFTLPQPTRSNYDFAGWTGTGLSSATKTVTIAHGSTGNRSYTATWTPTSFSITYTLNGGTLPSGTSNPGSYNIETATFTLPQPTRSHYDFAGWTGSNGDTPQTNVAIAQGSSGNKSYIAHWTPVDYSISYDLAGGALPDGESNPTTHCVTNTTITLVNPTRSHYIFAGWTGSNGNTPQTNVVIFAGSTGVLSYVANWTPVDYAISYDLAGGRMPDGTSNPTNYNVESSAIALAAPVRDGYDFAGWTGSNGNEPQVSVTIAAGSTGDRSYAAHWTPTSATFSFDSNGGDGEMPDLQFTTGAVQYIPSNAFVRADHVFAGWNTSSDGTGTAYAVGQAVELVTGPLTLYAQWVPTVCTLTYDSGDVTLFDGQVLEGTGGPNTHVVISPGATVTFGGVDITWRSGPWAGVTCLGDATIIAAYGFNTVDPGGTGYPGIQAGPPGTTLTIRGSGWLIVSERRYGTDDAAGIGSATDGACGDIVIEGGLIDATGGTGCGIGCGLRGICGDIVVNGGTVIAKGQPSAIAAGAGHAISIADELNVKLGDASAVPVAYANRVEACAQGSVRIEPCTHGGGVFVESGRARCEFCGADMAWFFGAGGEGTAESPWLLATVADWEELAHAVEGGLVTEGKFFQMTADIGTATNVVGVYENKFRGTFDGAGHKLTVGIGMAGNVRYAAPFGYVFDATIKNLKVSGSVAGDSNCAGLVCMVEGSCLVENCLVSVALAPGDSAYDYGGMVGHCRYSATTIRGCVFAGSINSSGGGIFVGGGYTGASPTLIDCLDASDSRAAVGLGSYGSLFVSNVYYSCDYKNTYNSWPEGSRGLRARSVTPGDAVEIDFGAPATVYSASGLTSYGTGVAYGGVFYAGEGETVSIQSLSSGNATAFSVEAGDIAPDGGAWKLTMPAADVVVQRRCHEIALAPEQEGRCWPEGVICLNVNDGTWTDVLEASPGASVLATYEVKHGWTVGSFSVVATNGASVPCSVQLLNNMVGASFTMPDSPVTVTPEAVATNYPALPVGATEVRFGTYEFIPSTTGVYSFELNDDAWGIIIYDATDSQFVSTSFSSLALIGGKTYYIDVYTDYPKESVTLAIAQTGAAELYPVTVVPGEHGTVEASLAAAPAGHPVCFTVVPDPGWDLKSLVVTGPDGASSVPCHLDFDDSYCCDNFVMPEGAVSVAAEFERSNRLRVGRTPILFENSGFECYFTAPEDGWYRFRSEDGGDSEVYVYDGDDNQVLIGDYADGNGNFDFLVQLRSGETCRLSIYYYGSDGSREAPIFVSRATVHSIAVDGVIENGSVEVYDLDGYAIDEALEGAKVLLEENADDGFALGAWNVSDATGGVVSVHWDDNDDCWYFRMPGTNVTVSAAFGALHAITPLSTVRAVSFGNVYVNGVYAGNQAGAVAGAEVRVEYRCTPSWAVSSFSVVTAGGAPVPSCVTTNHTMFSAVFTMPDASVSVTPNAVWRDDVPTLDIGDNTVAEGFWRFVAPSNGVYTFALNGMGGDWYMDVWDESNEYPGATTNGVFYASLAGGEVCNVDLGLYSGTGPAVLTIAWTGSVRTYRVNIASDIVGKLEASVTEAPAGRSVLVAPAPGLSMDSVSIRAANGRQMTVYQSLNYYGFWMPSSDVNVSARVYRECGIGIGENPLVFDDVDMACHFTAPEDGWYRFRTTDGTGSSLEFKKGDSYWELEGYLDDAGNIDFAVALSAGDLCTLHIDSPSDVSVSASLFVSRPETHAIAVEDDIAYGFIGAYDGEGEATEAPEGATIYLYAMSEDGYSLGAWNVVDATGGVVSVQWDSDGDFWYFRMPGTNVTVSATFGSTLPIVVMDDMRAWNDGILVNERPCWGDLSAVPGAKVMVWYDNVPGWEISSFAVLTASGKSVPCAVERPYANYTNYGLAVFTMPDEPVTVAPVVSRVALPTITVGDNPGLESGYYDFTAPTSGVYSVSVSGADNGYDLNAWDDAGYPIGSWQDGDFRFVIVCGEVCHLKISINDEVTNTVVVTVARVGDADLYPIVIAPEAVGIIAASVAEAPAGRGVLLAIDPGYDPDEVVVTDADGNEVWVDRYGNLCYFEMPSSAVTVTVEGLHPALPLYLEGADELVVSNYYVWAAKYGPDASSTHKDAFLLDIDPATPIPDGASLLKVIDFCITNGVLHLEVGSDVAQFKPKDAEVPMVGNGFLVLNVAMELSPDPDDWFTTDPAPATVRDGRAVVDMPLAPDGFMMPPAVFIRPSITDVYRQPDPGGGEIY